MSPKPLGFGLQGEDINMDDSNAQMVAARGDPNAMQGAYPLPLGAPPAQAMMPLPFPPNPMGPPQASCSALASVPGATPQSMSPGQMIPVAIQREQVLTLAEVPLFPMTPIRGSPQRESL